MTEPKVNILAIMLSFFLLIYGFIYLLVPFMTVYLLSLES